MSVPVYFSVPRSMNRRAKHVKKRNKVEIPLDRLKEPFYGDSTCFHNLLCGLNTTSRTVSSKQFNKPSIWNSTYPLPAYTSVVPKYNFDHVLDLAKKKKAFIEKLNSIKDMYRKQNSTITHNLQQIGSKKNANSMHVKNFAETLETDPDKYFNGSYNWYFTGGSMDFVNVNGEEFLVHSEGRELENLCISKIDFDRKEPIKQVDNFAAKVRTFGEGQTIYEIKSVVNEPYFTVRQKNTLSIAHLHTGKLQFRKLHSKIPLVASAIESPSMKLMMVNAKQDIQFFDLIEEKATNKLKIFENDMTTDNWCNVRFIENDRFICANRNKISVYDTRQPIQPIFCHDFSSSMGYCEDITCIEQSNGSYNTFIATTHKLFALDLRNCREGAMPLLRWVHQLKTPPIMMDIVRNGAEGELIAIAGVKSGDVRICDATTVNDSTISAHLPYTPLSVHDSLKFAKSYGKCLDPLSMIQEQIRQSNTGIKLKQTDSSEFLLLTKNSNGDIFKQEILPTHCPIIDGVPEIITRIEAWDMQLRCACETENKRFFEATDVTNLDSIITFLHTNMHKNLRPASVEPTNTELPKWKMSIDELSSYEDYLAPSILEWWNVNPDIVPTDETYKNERMNDWITSTVVEDNMIEIFDHTGTICVKSETHRPEFD